MNDEEWSQEFTEGFDFAIEVVMKVLENMELDATPDHVREAIEEELNLMANDN